MFSEEIRRDMVKQGRWRNSDWKGEALVVLIFGVPRDITRIEFKKGCDEVGRYCFAIET